MSNSIGTDRAHLLPPDHKLDDFRKPEVIAIESKICKDAAAFEKRVEDKPKRRKGYSAQNPKFTPDERIALIAEFKKRISSGEKLTMKVYATEKNMGLTTLTTMLQAVGFGKQRSREEIDLLVEEFKQEAEKGVSLKEFSAKKAIPYHTLHKDLNAAGLCEKRRSVDEILELLDQLSASGLTDEEFATQIGIHRETLRIWKSKAARNTLGKQNDCRADAKNRREKETAIIADYQHCKEKDANITPRKFSKLRNIPYSTLRSLFAKAGGLLASVKRHSRDEIRRIVQEFNEARQNNPGLKREEFALKHGITIDTLNCWLSGGFRELLFDQKQVPSSNNGGDNKCSPMDQTGR
jgi:predicted transcriptional regulator